MALTSVWLSHNPTNLKHDLVHRISPRLKAHRNLRLIDQGAFYNPPEEPTTIELDMEAFNRSAMAIARNRERTAALMRNARPLPTSGINNDILNSSVEGPVPSSPIAEPQLLAPHLTFLQ